MSDRQAAQQVTADNGNDAMAMLGVHINIPAVLDLLARDYEADNHNGLDEKLGMLSHLIKKHRELHTLVRKGRV